MKKRIISLLLVVSMVLSLLPVSALAAGTKDTAADSPFTDVKPGDWCYDAVLYAKANGFFSGTSETTFSPNGTMTRGMFVTVLGRMAGIDPAKYGGDTGFTDVPEGMYYAPYVKWAAQYGITGGTGDGRFSPDALITRQQMAALFVRYFEKFGIRLRFGRRGALCPGGRGEAVAGGSSERQRDAVRSHRQRQPRTGGGTVSADGQGCGDMVHRAGRGLQAGQRGPGGPDLRQRQQQLRQLVLRRLSQRGQQLRRQFLRGKLRRWDQHHNLL